MNGEEWLVTHVDTETHTLNVYEQLVAVVNVITLNSRQYCVIIDPNEGGKPQLGRKVCISIKEICLFNIWLFFFRNLLLVKNHFFFNQEKNLKMVFKMFIFWEKTKVLFLNVLKNLKINKLEQIEILVIVG